MKLNLKNNEKHILFRDGAVEINRGIFNIYVEKGGTNPKVKGYTITITGNYTDINVDRCEEERYGNKKYF